MELNEPFPTNTGQNPTDLDEVVKLSKPVVVPALGSTKVKGLTAKTIITGHRIHNYCEMKDSSRSVYLVLRNGTSWPIHLLGGNSSDEWSLLI